MTDEFMQKARDAWRSQDVSFEAVRARLRRTRWSPHLAMAWEMLGAVVSLLIGLWFVWMAIRTGLLVFTLSAIVMLLTAPVGAIASFVLRRGSLRWEDETPDGVLRTALRRSDASLRVIRFGRWQLAVICAFVLVLWVTCALGLIRERWFVILYSIVSVVTVVPWFFGLRSYERRVLAERANCERLLQDQTLP